MNSVEIRARVATELRLDLIGTGFLVPVDTPSRRKARDPQEEMDTAERAAATTRTRIAARRTLAISVLDGPEPAGRVWDGTLRVTARWGDPRLEEVEGENRRTERRSERHFDTLIAGGHLRPLALA